MGSPDDAAAIRGPERIFINPRIGGETLLVTTRQIEQVNIRSLRQWAATPDRQTPIIGRKSGSKIGARLSNSPQLLACAIKPGEAPILITLDQDQHTIG